MATSSYSGQANSNLAGMIQAVITDPSFCPAVNACLAGLPEEIHIIGASIIPSTTTLQMVMNSGPSVTVDLGPAVLSALGTAAGQAAIVAAAVAGLVTGVGIKGDGSATDPYAFAALELPTEAAPTINGIVASTGTDPDGARITLAQLGAALTAAGAVSVGSVVENADGTVDTILNGVTGNSVRVINEQSPAAAAPAATDVLTMLIGGQHVAVTATQLASTLATILPDVKLQSGIYNATTKALDFTLSNGSVVSIPVAALLPVLTDMSVQGDGSTTAITLVNDLAAPGATLYYGTDAAGVKGWQSFPANTPLNVVDSASIDLFVSGLDGHTLTGDVRIDTVTPGNVALTIGPDGLKAVATIPPAGSVIENAATGTVDTTVGAAVGNAILSIPEQTALAAGTLDPLLDFVTVWDASAGKHVKVPVTELRAPIQVTYYDTITAPAATVATRTIKLPLNTPYLRSYGFHAIINGEVWSAGQNVNGIAGGTDGNGEHTRLPSVMPFSPQNPATAAPVGRVPVFTKHWVNAKFAVYLDSLGKLWVRGTNFGRQSGVPSWAIGDAAELPTLIPFFENSAIQIIDVAISGNMGNDDYTSVYAIDSTGKLYAWGRNNVGQLGLGNTVDQATPVLVGGLLAGKTVIQVAAAQSNGDHTMVLCNDGTLYGAGEQGGGELGIGSTAQQNTWVLSRTGVAFVTVSPNASFIIDTAGKVWGAGVNSSGWFGRGNTTNSTSWVQSTSFTGVADQVYVGSLGQMSIYIRENGNLWIGGANTYSQLGLSGGSAAQANNHTLLPALIAPFQGTVAEVVFAGNNTPTAYVRTTDGKVWSAGYNAYGQRGLGNRIDTAAYRSVWAQAAWHRPIQLIRPFAVDNSGTMVVVDDLGRIATCGFDTQSFDSLGNWSSALRNYPIATY